MKLTRKQTVALDFLEDNITNEAIFGGGAGGAKSVLGCYWLGKNCLKYPETRWLMGRAVLKTLKDTTLNSFFWVMAQQGLRSNYHYIYNAQRNIIRFPETESEILLKDLFTYPSDPNFDELGSLEITGGFVDEVNQISLKAWNISKSRIRWKLDEYGLIPKMLGTCNPSKNWVYTDFYKPSKDGKLPQNKQFVQALLSDNPFISKHYRDNLLQLDTNSKERLLFGNWEYDDDPTVLMDYNNIVNSFSNNFVATGDNYITADIARFGSDKTVIGVWKGYRLEYIKTIGKNSITEAASEIETLRQYHGVPINNVLVDEDGVGGGVKDILKCNGFVNNSTPIVSDSGKENFANLKSQCSFKLAERVNKNEVFINCLDTTVKDMIIEELGQIKQRKIDSDDKKAVVRKEDVKEALGRSPDYADMIMMRVWFDLRKEFKFW